MPTYIVTKKSDGAEVYRYVADAHIEWVGMEFATHDHIEQIEASDPVPVASVYGGRRTLSRFEFLELFTQAERISIKQARGVSPSLDDYLYLLELAQEVHLDSANTQAGVNMLEQVGILALGRAMEILNG